MIDAFEELLKQLERYLADDPSRVPKVLELTNKSLKRFEESVKQKREKGLYNAFSMGFGYFGMKSKNKKDMLVPSLIDSMFYMFPNSTWEGCSKADKTILFNFLDIAIEKVYLNKHEDWLKNIKGNEIYFWLIKLIENYKTINWKK